MSKRLFFMAAAAGFLAGCVTAPPAIPPPTVVTPPTFAPPPAAVSVTRLSALARLDPHDVPPFADDLDTASLRTAALQSLAYYQGLPAGQLFVLGGDSYTARDMGESMAALSDLLARASSRDWLSNLRAAFAVYQSVGTNADRTVTFSSYYEPTIAARLFPDSAYRFPFYARPPDLIDVDLGLFDAASQGARIAGRREGRALVPYAARADIDSAKVLQGQGLELAWAKDPQDVLDLQIEGSGWLDLGNGGLRRIRYDGDNGRRYKSVGQNLIATGRIPAAKFSRQAYLRYLSSHPEERQALLNVDERYIFFRIDTSTSSPFAYGDINVPLTPGRSIATDPKIFPKGALAWITLPGIQRFVLTQDEGGAIQGPGRVDIFAGRGEDAARFAGHLWDQGKLYFLVKKKS